MKGLREYLTRRVLGYLAVAAVAALLSVVSGVANAAAYSDQGDAFAGCHATGKADVAAGFGVSYTCNPGSNRYVCTRQQGAGGSNTCTEQYHVYPGGSTCATRGPLGEFTSSTFSACSRGCRYEPSGPALSVQFGAAAPIALTSGWEPTGAVCSEGPPSENGECKALGANQTACLKPNGDHCHTASTGRQICWSPGEKGEKTDADKLQKNQNGDTPSLPDKAPPPNDSFLDDPATDPVVVKTTEGPNTQTTVVNNWTTSSGGPAGGSNSGGTGGTPGTDNTGGGSGGGSGGGDGEGDEGEGNSTGGDGNCAGGWAPSGDAILSAILQENWKTRCAGEKGEQDLRDTIGQLEGATPENGEGDSIFGAGTTNESIDENIISFGATCPSFSIPLPWGGAFVPPPEFCTLGAALRALFILIAYVWALRIVTD